MSPEEVKDKLKSTINHIIKGDAEAATAEFHDVLAAKMRDRVSPEVAAATTDDTSTDENTNEDDETVEVDPPATTEE
jgi:hypothetical protein